MPRQHGEREALARDWPKAGASGLPARTGPKANCQGLDSARKRGASGAQSDRSITMPTSPRTPGRYGQAGQLFSKQTQAIFYNWCATG